MKRLFTLLIIIFSFCYSYYAQDDGERLSEMQKHAEAGDILAQKFMGDYYFGGDELGEGRDYEKALYWYSKAADRGDAASQFLLGLLYRDSDKEKALYWMRKYAEQGYDDGQAMLGYWYMGGDGFPKDYVQAVAWLKKSADQGNKEAASDLSKCYENGNGVQRDMSMAKHWKSVAEQKDDDIDKYLATIQWPGFESNVTSKEFPLNLSIASSSRVEDVTIMHNGSKVKGTKLIKGVGYNVDVVGNVVLADGSNTIEAVVRNAGGSIQDGKTVVYGKFAGKMADIEWIEFKTTSDTRDYNLKLGINSESKIEDVSIALNGELSRGITTVEASDYDMVIERMVTLADGINRIVVNVRNAEGIAKSEKVIAYQSGDTGGPGTYQDKRIAMIVGNSNYADELLNLANPVNDATDVAEKLKKYGFVVILKLDATHESMDMELVNFGQKAKEYDVALFYYAGHGIQSKGVNYLLPTDIDNLTEDNIKYKCVNMEYILDIMESSKCKLNMVVLDACRNDPISRSWHRSIESHGLSIMSAPEGTIISFSTAPGHTALDGDGRNSPYTAAFLKALDYPNLDVLHFLKMVGSEVIDKTKNMQRPWMSSSFTGDFYFNKQ
ncbi:MAG: caspase family protein [Bacteroidales bacterium]|nr:caspase family protein [Bacteroidales bacterium]